MLRITDLNFAIEGKPLFEGANAFIPTGHKVGLIGRNGAGKTTLFKLIRGELQTDGGDITLPTRARIGGVAQEVPSNEVSLIDTVLAADVERAALLKESETATDANRISEIQTRLTDIDAWSAEARASSILKGLGFDDAEQLMPTYLRFVRGVIDSSDLPLNVSREILQQSKEIDSIRAGSVKRVLDLIGGLAKNDSEKFASFWAQFGKVLKEGVVEDTKNRDVIAGLLRFASTRGDGDAQIVSLEDYVGRMPEGQERIYYVTADRYATALNSPHLEIFQDKNI